MRGFHNSSFDPPTLVVLEAAFDEAWLTLKSIGNQTVKPDELARAVLRPDLYAGTTHAVDDTAVARAQEYALLAALLARPPDAALLKRLAKARQDATREEADHNRYKLVVSSEKEGESQ